MRNSFFLKYLILTAAQAILGNFLNLSPYITLCFLPAMVLCLPGRMGSLQVMIIAFLTGLAVDFTTHGILGLTVAALLPVAFFRNGLLSIVLGNEAISRRENLSVGKQGMAKVALCILLCSAIFFAIYAWIDAAGTRSFGFNLLRTVLSTLVSTVAGLPVATLLTEGED